MLHQQTIAQLQALRLEGIALCLQEQFTQRASTACLKDVDYRPGRGLDKKQVAM